MLDIEIDTVELAQLTKETKEKMKQAAAAAMGEYIDYFTEPIWEYGEDNGEEEEWTAEATMPLPIEKTIADLANSDKPILNSELIGLSNLTPEELRILKQAWDAPFSFGN